MEQLRRNRFFLFLSLIALGTAAGMTATILEPDGSIRARNPAWGPRASVTGATGAASVGIAGFAADRSGGECGLVRRAGGAEAARRTLPGCHSYQSPSVLTLGGRTVAVWEHGDREIAVSAIEPDLSIGRTLYLPRPATSSGTLLPRTAVRSSDTRVAIWYSGDRVVSVGASLVPWPDGPVEVAGARLGPRAFVLLFGIVALLAFYLVAAGWTLGLPRRLRRRHQGGRCLEVTLPARGTSVVVDGRAVRLDLSGAWTFGDALQGLRGRAVTLITRGAPRSLDAYRERDTLRVDQVWPGTFAEALCRARALRTGTVALAILAAAVLVLGLNAYLAL